VDPDSLALTPDGDLLLDDQGGAPLGTQPLPSLTLVRHPGTSHQHTAQIFPMDEAGNPLSLDDTRFAPPGSKQLLIADTSANIVYLLKGRFHSLAPYSATKGSGTVGRLNLHTGLITPVVSKLSSPHGLAFVPRHEREDDDDQGDDD
jgi:hypothetical protein